MRFKLKFTIFCEMNYVIRLCSCRTSIICKSISHSWKLARNAPYSLTLCVFLKPEPASEV